MFKKKSAEIHLLVFDTLQHFILVLLLQQK